MNGQTAKLIRKIASVRGIRSPRKIRAIKREYYGLNQEQRELQKIEWRMEVDNFVNGIHDEFEQEKTKVLREKQSVESKADSYKSRAKQVRTRYETLKDNIESAPFGKRLNYLVTRKVEAIAQ